MRDDERGPYVISGVPKQNIADEQELVDIVSRLHRQVHKPGTMHMDNI